MMLEMFLVMMCHLDQTLACSCRCCNDVSRRHRFRTGLRGRGRRASAAAGRRLGDSGGSSAPCEAGVSGRVTGRHRRLADPAAPRRPRRTRPTAGQPPPASACRSARPQRCPRLPMVVAAAPLVRVAPAAPGEARCRFTHRPTRHGSARPGPDRPGLAWISRQDRGPAWPGSASPARLARNRMERNVTGKVGARGQ
jgi:hypothetical protein